MRLTNKVKRLIAMISVYMLLFGILAPNAALAGESRALVWDNVLKLKQGDKVTIVLLNRESHQGKVDKAEPTGITITTKTGSLLIPREDVRSVRYLGKPRMANPGTWMAGGGVALLGAGLWGTVKDASDVRGGRVTGSTGSRGMTLSIIGAGVLAGGVAVSVLGGRPKPIYEGSAK